MELQGPVAVMGIHVKVAWVESREEHFLDKRLQFLKAGSLLSLLRHALGLFG